MGTMDDFLKDYIFSGMDDEGLTDNNTELMRYLFEDDLLSPPANLSDWDSKPNDVRKSKLGENQSFVEQYVQLTRQDIEYRVIYAMRDSMEMSTFEFAGHYNPTNPFSKKGAVLFQVVDETIFGITDLDWAMTLLQFSAFIIQPSNLYPFGKRLWNIKRGFPLNYLYNNTAELNAKLMADMMADGKMKFHELFPQYLDKANDSSFVIPSYLMDIWEMRSI